MQIRDDSVTVGAQQSADWFNQRIGKLTASCMGDAMSFLKNGKESEARNKLKIAIVTERMTDTIRDTYVTPAMMWGIEKEPEAKLAYVAKTGMNLRPAPFIEHPGIEYFGASPDGLLDQEGLAEFKCPTSAKHVAWMLAGVVPEEHKPQMLAQLACTGRSWVEFISYDPRMPEKQRLFIRRFDPKPEEINAVEEAARQFLKEVDELFERLTEAA